MVSPDYKLYAIYIYIYLEPKWPRFLKGPTQPPQFQGRNSNQKTGGPQVGDRGAARLASALEKNEDHFPQRFPAFRGGGVWQFTRENIPIASMGLVYLPTFTIGINHSCRWIYITWMVGDRKVPFFEGKAGWLVFLGVWSWWKFNSNGCFPGTSQAYSRG